MLRTHRVLLALSVVSSLALAACGSGQPGNSTAASSGSQSASSGPIAEAGHYHAELALVGQPEITADGKDILVTVDVTNDGPGVFGSTTEPNNVNLGAHSIDASGAIVDNDLSRGHLPQIVAGATKQATILLPIDKTLGHRVELLPVQENVAWFDQWGTKPLIVGPFGACSSHAVDKVCDAAGKPLPIVPVTP